MVNMYIYIINSSICYTVSSCVLCVQSCVVSGHRSHVHRGSATCPTLQWINLTTHQLRKVRLFLCFERMCLWLCLCLSVSMSVCDCVYVCLYLCLWSSNTSTVLCQKGLNNIFGHFVLFMDYDTTASCKIFRS